MIQPNECEKLRFEALQKNTRFIEGYIEDKIKEAINQGKDVVKISLMSMDIHIAMITREYVYDREALNQAIKNLNKCGWHTKLCTANSDPFFDGLGVSTVKEECLFISKNPIEIKEYKKSIFNSLFGWL